MFRNATAALLTCLLAAGAAFAVQPRVNDSAGFFSPAAVDSANQKIKQISSEFKTDLVIDTVAEVPADMQAKFKEQGNTKFFEEWARKRGADATVKGIYILICKKPGHLAVEIENATRAKAFTVSDRERLVKRMTEAFKEKKYDDGLRAAVDMVYSTLRERVPRKATTPVPLTQKPGKLQPITQKPAAPKKAEAGTSLMGWVCIGLLAVGVIWIIFRVIGAFTGRGQAGPGYGAPGEGFDVPAVEVVTMVRRTESLALYMQQFGRALRIMEGKEKAIIIDHVGNWKRHGPPDKIRQWSLEPSRGSGGDRSDMTEYIQCLNPACMAPYPAELTACPCCGWRPERSGEPVPGAAPVQVMGDLSEVDPAEIESLLGAVARVDGSPKIPANLSDIAAAGLRKQWILRQQAQAELRTEMGIFGGMLRDEGLTDREIQRAFFLTFSVDVLSAQALKSADAHELRAKIGDWLTGRGIDRSSAAS